MKRKIWILFLLGSLIFVWGCGGGGGTPPQHVSKPKQMAGYAYDYLRVGMKWINRDGWDYNDGSTEQWFSVSYNYYAADWCDDFADKIDSSSTTNQIYWSEYTSYRPGGRNMDDPEAYPWAGTFCQGLVYRSAIKAGYSISSSYLNCIDCWQNLGTEVIIPEEGDFILMDFDTTNPGYEHLGIMWGLLPHILSAVAIYYRPTFEYKAGIHTEQQYDEALAEEFPDLHLQVYDRKYIRLPE
jgi:hypothetical protein